MSGIDFDAIPGFVNRRDQHGETTITIETGRIVEAGTHLRDELGFTFLADLAGADYLGWGEQGVAGYIGTVSGRDLHEPGSQGLAHVPAPKPKRFSVSYHLLRVGDDPVRLRVQVWLDDGEAVATLVPVWPAADWLEREAWDMLGVRFDGHPNLVRILMPEDWEGYPLRKDYPLGGEPVRFSGED